MRYMQPLNALIHSRNYSSVIPKKFLKTFLHVKITYVKLLKRDFLYESYTA